MIALNILDLRAFMSAFLVRDLFDRYRLIESQITTFCTHSIDGRLERSFFESREQTAGDALSDPSEGTGTSEGAFSQSRSGISSGRPSVEYVRWSMVKPHVYGIIRGKRTPLFFKFIFFYPPEDLASFLMEHGISPEKAPVSGLCLNLRYDGRGLVLTTGTSMSTFSMDRSADEAWDAAVRELLKDHHISYEDV